MILRTRPLWLGQSDRSWALGAATPGALPMPGALPSGGTSTLKGTWSNDTPNGLHIISHSRNSVGQDCDWEGTYDDWQANGIWNPCAPSQPPGEVVAVGYTEEDPGQMPPQVVAPAPPAPAPPPPAAAPPQPVGAPLTPPPPPPANPGTIPVQNPNVFNPPPPFTPVPVLVPGAAPATAPKAVPAVPAASKSGTTTALVAGGLGIVGVAAALFFGGAFK